MGSLFVACIFVIVPFYYEVTYNISNVVTWWDWYNRFFFFKFIFIYTIILYIGYSIQIGFRWLNWKKIFFLSFIIFFFFIIFNVCSFYL
jgi:hypothetical protein